MQLNNRFNHLFNNYTRTIGKGLQESVKKIFSKATASYIRIPKKPVYLLDRVGSLRYRVG
jgi:hypothetical protein